MGKKLTNLGISLNDEELLIVQSLVAKSKAVIDKWGQLELDRQLVKEGRILNISSLADKALDLISQLKVQTDFATINLPSQFNTIKIIEINRNVTLEFPDWYKWEIQNFLLEPIENYSISAFDMQVSFNPDSSLYAIVAVPKQIIDERINFLETLGLIPVTAEPDPVAVYNCYSFGEEDIPPGKTLFMDISIPYTTLFLVNEGRFIFGGNFPSGEGFISQARTGYSPANEILSGFIKNLIENFNQYFKLTGLNIPQKKPNRLFFTGHLCTNELCGKISNLLGIEYETRDPFNEKNFGISFKKKPDALWYRLFLPVGLALRNIHE
ncbi:hypothetical protein JW877_07455 [bacterium]|nr:hypothetical protein [bacterium]